VGARMIINKTATRNREIFSAHQNGESIEGLARRYGLAVVTVREIIRVEKHKVAVSVEGYYEDQRARKSDLQL
jgi:Mor family transcriptional regulator